MGATPDADRAAGGLSGEEALIRQRSRIRTAMRLSEFGAQLEHVVKLLEHALPPPVILVEQASGIRSCKLSPAEKCQKLFG